MKALDHGVANQDSGEGESRGLAEDGEMDLVVSIMGAVGGFHRLVDEVSEIRIGTCLVCEDIDIVLYCCVDLHTGPCSLELAVVVDTS